MSLCLAISPCPNDIYTYAALLEKKIPNDITFKVAPIGELNRLALAGAVDAAKISAGTFPMLKDRYTLLPIGASFGTENGPKLVVRKDRLRDLQGGAIIATPGLTTTASFVVQKLFPNCIQKEEALAEIPKLVSEGRYDFGLVINEAMQELASYGLVAMLDLSKVWFERVGSPLPLGLVVIAKHLDADGLTTQVQASIAWAKEHHNEALAIALRYASEKNPAALSAHVDQFTKFVDDSSRLHQAIAKFMQLAI